MKKNSTFIYFVNKFRCQSDTDFGSMNRSSEKKLTGMESGLKPSERTIQTIMDFAQSYDVLETHTAGQIEMNYN